MEKENKGLKVKDLIKHLQTFNPELSVFVGDSQYPEEPMTENELHVKGGKLIIY